MSGNVAWTDAELALLHELAKAGADPDVCSNSFPGRTWHACRHKMAEVGIAEDWRDARKTLEAAPDREHKAPDFGEPPKKPIDLMEHIARAERRAPTRRGNKDYRRVIIKTDRPIAVMMSADWHFGGLDVDYPALAEHVSLLLDVPGMYLQLFGDTINMMLVHRAVAARRDHVDPDEQIEFLRTLIHETVDRGKLISMGTGNHDDEFTERTAGFGLVKLITERAVPYFRGLGYLDLVLQTSDGDEQTYPLAFVHKTRFSSFMNPVHGNKRMLQMHNEFFGRDRPIACCYITAHTHNPAIAVEGLTPAQRIYMIKCGTFKTDCLYSQRYFGQGRIGVPTMVFHADRYELVGLPNPWLAYRYISGEDWT